MPVELPGAERGVAALVCHDGCNALWILDNARLDFEQAVHTCIAIGASYSAQARVQLYTRLKHGHVDFISV